MPNDLTQDLLVVEEAHRWAMPVSVCGEMAGDPRAALVLLGMGATNISMAGIDLPHVKRVTGTFRHFQACDVVDQALRLDGASEVRDLLADALDKAGLGGLIGAGR